MEGEKIHCGISLEIAYDPVKIGTDEKYVYDRHSLETLLEKHPNDTLVPHTRRAFSAVDLIPYVSKRQQIRSLLKHELGNDYTEWEVVQDYPLILQPSAIVDTLEEIRACVYSIKKSNDLNADTWLKAWKKLNYLRLNLQYECRNRHIFLRNNDFIRYLGQIIELCLPHPDWPLQETAEEYKRFQREVLRMIRVLAQNMSYRQLVSQMVMPTKSKSKLCIRNRSSKVLRFLLRLYKLGDEGLHVIILSMMKTSVISERLGHDDINSIMYPILQAEPHEVSCFHLAMAAEIFKEFYKNNKDNERVVNRIEQHSIQALVKIFNFLLIKKPTLVEEKDGDRDISKIMSQTGIGYALFLINEFFNRGNQSVHEWLYNADLLSIIHDMFQMIAEGTTTFCLYNWEVALKIAKTMYRDGRGDENMRQKHYDAYRALAMTIPIGNQERRENIKQLLDDIMKIFKGFAY